MSSRGRSWRISTEASITAPRPMGTVSGFWLTWYYFS